ncbi:aKG-HExxH-type peptide beta-hydroxylase [Laceyella sacchari]|uniref:HEXXH motif-containing putative peptide modification protein n=1 Tax=Laceyella sacchari TaxID=37482 RepID=A0ABY5U0Z9_LACSH|nr:HEXXH motif-containing putative peptide modification protein [Laceyella sacchari]UWE02250.1 HEXXH motif-containing putative peptide modification protein [Laceyella sacchari]
MSCVQPKQGKQTCFPFLHSKNIIQNIETIITVFNPETPISEENRKRLFFDVINTLQSSSIPNKPNGIHMQFDNEALTNLIVKSTMLSPEDVADGKHLFNDEEREMIQYKMEKALDLIKILHPNLHYLMTQLIGTLYFIKKEGNGGDSVSSLIGLIWLNPQPDWTVIDYAECMYHEFIHNSLFLDDMVNTIFPDTEVLGTEDALVTSSILKWKRPLDRSFHSAAVAIALSHFYTMLGDTKKAQSYLPSVEQTVEELNSKTKYLGEQGVLTLNQMNHFLKARDYESLSKFLF